MSTLPKIPLDRSSDVTFLRLQLQQALASRLQTHLPNALPEDQFRSLIETHISAFLSRTMQAATTNVTINGLPPRPSDLAKGVQVEGEGEGGVGGVEGYEPFDAALRARLLAKHALLEETITRVTTMRREVPRQVVAAVRTTMQRDNATLHQNESGKQEDDDDDEDEDREEEEGVLRGLQEVQIPRLDEVRESYEKSVRMMREMKGSVGSVSAKVSRAKEVLTYIREQQQQQSQDQDQDQVEAQR